MTDDTIELMSRQGMRLARQFEQERDLLACYAFDGSKTEAADAIQEAGYALRKLADRFLNLSYQTLAVSDQVRAGTYTGPGLGEIMARAAHPSNRLHREEIAAEVQAGEHEDA